MSESAAAMVPTHPTGGQSRPTALWGTFTVDQRRLKRTLLERGWTMAEWARRALVSETTAGRFLRELPVAPKSAYALITALGLSPAEIIVDREPVA